jgi:branched-chain amino acid aminotransferase
MVFLFYFGRMDYICLNGKIIVAAKPVLMASNRGFRYGDGLFETMKVINEKIRLEDYHFERLWKGLSLLKYELPKLFSPEKLKQELIQLCKKNGCSKLARTRLTIFRGNGGLYDEDKGLQYLMEAWPLNETLNRLNDNGLVVDIYPDAKKSCDVFANLKSANFLPYTMAALYAKENKWNDCLVLNQYGRIADTTIANIFLVKDNVIITPALSEGCVDGVMRKYISEQLQVMGYELRQTSVNAGELENADEVFLTNAMYGIRWIRQFRNKIYTNTAAVEIYNRLIKTILL